MNNITHVWKRGTLKSYVQLYLPVSRQKLPKPHHMHKWNNRTVISSYTAAELMTFQAKQVDFARRYFILIWAICYQFLSLEEKSKENIEDKQRIETVSTSIQGTDTDDIKRLSFTPQIKSVRSFLCLSNPMQHPTISPMARPMARRTNNTQLYHLHTQFIHGTKIHSPIHSWFFQAHLTPNLD